MILLALVVVALFLFSKGSGSVTVSGDGVSGAGVTPLPPAIPVTPPSVSAPVTPVIQNATGGSLSAALGSSQAPPGYYVTGNPGYNTQTKPVNTLRPVNRSGAPFSTFKEILPIAPPQPVAVNRGVVGVPQKTPTNPAGTFKPIIANRPVVVNRFSPEVASAPWTKIPVARKA